MILVTGATGKVGGQVAKQLAEAGADVRALVRDPDRARAALPEGVEIVRGDLTDLTGLETALEGVEAAFLMWPLHGPEGAAEVVGTLARHAGRLVYLSAGGGDQGPDEEADPEDGIMGGHAHLERLVRDSGAEWTLLRPGGFASNTLGWADKVRAGGPVRIASPRAARALVHEADIAAVAVRALLTDELVGRAPGMTGPEVLTQAEMVQTIGEVLGRPLKVEEQPREEAHAELVAAGLPDHYAEGILDAHVQMEHEPEAATTDFPTVMGRQALTYRDWVTDHVADFS
ncbi:SDR family oxidoreductase [Streptomyces iconiensis]|uniref:NAD(P)H-binding protein n=1 Tax=Streptomyces iconiensis TaxID=1384038 RepID=A0ABT6ZUM2_9ACTN|nr:NAD(P)H-binding protein [Streptomyces iconiensis]MDJ1132767.1 NAD(P)H-binding protein [Streptomyces iconiensis]